MTERILPHHGSFETWILSHFSSDHLENEDWEKFKNEHFYQDSQISINPDFWERLKNSIGEISSDRRFGHPVQKAAEKVLIDESKKIQKILVDIYNDNSKLITLSGWEFEEMVAELLSKQGYKVELTQKTKDNGYDIIALMNMKMQNPLKFLVECKRYSQKKVGVEIIRGFKEVISAEGANKGIIVTTSYFTKGALDKQKEIPYLLDYRDKDKVIEWVNEYFK